MTETSLISPEILIPRLGDQLVEMGLLTVHQLIKALDYQKLRAANGDPVLLGQAVMEMGFLDRPTLDKAVTEQIYRLRAALEEANHNLELRVQQRTMELEEALRRLFETNQLKTNIIANVSHELRTPLTHIHGYLDLLYTETLGDLNPDQKKALAVSLQSSMRLQALIDNLILFAQASRGQMTLTLGPVDLSQLAIKILDGLKPCIEDHQLKLEVNITPGLPCVQADEEKLSWVISQLLDNAIKFTNPGGSVRLGIRKDLAAANMVTIFVEDTGIGISKEGIEEIFEPFHQLDGSATRRYGGTGLGLTLALQIIEAHGSVIDVHSELDRGTTISFPITISKAD